MSTKRHRPNASQKNFFFLQPECVPVHLELCGMHQEELNWFTPQKCLFSNIYIKIILYRLFNLHRIIVGERLSIFL
jgi:hypothetical protein